MPFEDYEKFLQLYKNHPKLKLLNGAAEKRPPFLFTKVHDSSTMFTPIEFLPYPELYMGVYVDIFPLIGTPNDTAKRGQFQKDLDMTVQAIHEKAIYNYGETSLESLMQTYLSLCRQFRYDDSVVVQNGAFPPNFTSKKLTFSRSSFATRTLTSFEKIPMYIPEGYDHQLSTQYGDYMKLPPKSQRFGHHENVTLVDYAKSYLEYADEASRSHLTEHYRAVFTEKYDILQRIPPLESRIKLEASEAEKLREQLAQQQNTGVRKSTKQLAKSIRRKLEI